MRTANIAIVPARGGSKRIPRKNIRSFSGKPIIAYSIETAIASGLFDQVIVSTDNGEIADVAKSYGACVPFLRPAKLADDYVGTIPVIRHAIERLREQQVCPDYVCCIYATAPFLTPSNLKRGWEILQSTGASYAFSITSYPFPIQRALRETSDGRIAMFQPECFAMRSQDLETAYHDAGQFYWGKATAFVDEIPIFSAHSAPVLLARHQVQDIDTMEDWQRAELMFEAWRQLIQEEEQPFHSMD